MDLIARLKGFFSGREERPEIGDSVFLGYPEFLVDKMPKM